MEEARNDERDYDSPTELGAEGLAASGQGGEESDENEQIRTRAYERWLARGGEGGDERDDWFEAEREYRQRSASGERGDQREGDSSRD